MKDIKKVLILGNSITNHKIAPHLGWHNEWGMAASAKENDFVHILKRNFEAINPDIDVKADVIINFETGFWEVDLCEFKRFRDYDADIIIMRISENVDDKNARKYDFSKYYKELIEYLCLSDNRVIVTDGFWVKSDVNPQIKAVADELNLEFVHLTDLVEDKTNMALGEFEHEGVAAHPSDKGMKKIADRIWAQIIK